MTNHTEKPSPATEAFSRLLDEYQNLRDGGRLNAATAAELAQRAADLIFNRFQNGVDYPREAVTLICQIATAADPEIAGAGVLALFPGLVERLNDSFEPAACAIYDRIFAQVIDYCRRLPEGRSLDKALRGLGLSHERDLLARRSRLQKRGIPRLDSPQSVKKVLLLSRVTIGADVAVTSVIIAKLRAALPAAEFVLLGSGKLKDLFGGDPRISVREIAYQRGGRLLSRLQAWLSLVEAVDEELHGLEPEEFLLIDPDSRLTQLGLLPLLRNEDNYLFFESRSYQLGEAIEVASREALLNHGSLGFLASHWIGRITGSLTPVYPFIALPLSDRQFGRAIVERLSRAGRRRLITVSFGVGGNDSKRVSDEFETALTERLLKDATLILDKGASAGERQQIDRIVKTVRAQGYHVIEVNQQNAAEVLRQEKIVAHVLTWDGGIGAFASLIAESDQYIGYDSAGQHIAAALGVPVLTIFINSPYQTFAKRWRPYGPGRIVVLHRNRQD